jgi:hypothetical protein
MGSIVIPRPNCLYCGEPCLKIKRGEHIFPESIGGQKTLEKKNVCTDCNTTVLSSLDDDLAYHSYLSLLVSHELRNVYGKQWDMSPDGILTEAESLRDEKGYVQLFNWPQLVLLEKGFGVFGDSLEATEFGVDQFRTTVLKKGKKCYERFTGKKLYAGDRGLYFERMADGILPRVGKYPPRVYAKTRIKDFTDETSMHVRYVKDEEKQQVLEALRVLDPSMKFTNEEHAPGSMEPHAFRSSHFLLNIRVFIKIGINLISETCKNTVVDRSTFRPAIDAVLEEGVVTPTHLTENGFVAPAAFNVIHDVEGNGHSARLVFSRVLRRWTAYLSFFGGKMAAQVSFPGISNENWLTADVGAPLVSKDPRKAWKDREKLYADYLPLNGAVIWDNPSRLCPCIEFKPGGEFQYEMFPAKAIRKRWKKP